MDIQIKSISIDGKKLTLKNIKQLPTFNFSFDIKHDISNFYLFGYYIINQKKIYVCSFNNQLFSFSFSPSWNKILGKPVVSFKNRYKQFNSIEDAQKFVDNYNYLKNKYIDSEFDIQLFY